MTGPRRPTLAAGDWLTTSQVAHRLGVSDTRVRQLAAAGRLELIVTPLGRLFTAASVDAHAAARLAAR